MEGKATHERPPTITRRQAIVVGSAVLATPAVVKIDAKFNPLDPEPTALKQAPENNPQMTELTYTSMEAEPQMSIEQHLVNIYGDNMSEENYKTPEDKLQFMHKLHEVAKRLNPQNPNLVRQLAAAINFETGGSFSSSETNAATNATGLIQFMPDTAIDMGTNIENLSTMNPTEQLNYVEDFLRGQTQYRGVELDNISNLYMSILWPAGMKGPVDQVIFSKFSKHKDVVASYIANNGLDQNRDGSVEKAEATVALITAALDKGEKLENLLTPEEIEYYTPLLTLHEEIQKLNTEVKELHVNNQICKEIISANTKVIEDAKKGLYEYSIPGFGQGKTLQGVRITLDEVYKDYDFSSELSGLSSAFEIADVLKNHKEKFSELSLSQDVLLHYLPIGSIIVFNPNDTDSDAIQFDQGNGRVVIVRPNSEDGESLNGSDHESLLSEDLNQMPNGYRVFVPISPK